MKRLKPSDAEMSLRDEVRAERQRHYDAIANGEASETEREVLGLVVGKGPRGKWYVKNGKEIVVGPFETETEAVLAKEREAKR
jgi:hypothetical protein